MKKIFSTILMLFCIFSFNLNFFVEEISAKDIKANPEVEQVAIKNIKETDILNEPVFEKEPNGEKSKINGRLSSIIIKILGGIILGIVVLVCLSFIFIANEQRRRENKQKKFGSDSNVINAVDNFAKHRIKR